MSVAAVTTLGVGAAFGATVSGWGPAGGGAAADGASAPADSAADGAAGPADSAADGAPAGDAIGGIGGGAAAGLPVTTSAVGGVVILGVGLAGAGTALLVVRRRRNMGELAEP